MTPPTKILEAAALLGIPASEVINVEDSPAGTIITTFDGVRYVDVPESTPDAKGRSGLMLLFAPTKTYGGSLAVYAQPGEEDETEAVEAGDAAAVLAAMREPLAEIDARLKALESPAKPSPTSTPAKAPAAPASPKGA
ncbi:MAG: hypothetical protein QOD63_1497 [Actinomycetota bacterium]|jgi:hypothetical protein|nr:hypothetical protein [Actinomycetota bacterium]